MKNYQQSVKQRRIKLEKAKTLRHQLTTHKPVVTAKNKRDLIDQKQEPHYNHHSFFYFGFGRYF